jgi:hypothetical protein
VAAPSLPPPPSAQAVAANSAYGYNPARSYSVVREFGGTPDRIPAPPPQSAFAGRGEIALDPALMGGSDPDRADEPQDQDEDAQPATRPATAAPAIAAKAKGRP